jgi:hypothetical protein
MLNPPLARLAWVAILASWGPTHPVHAQPPAASGASSACVLLHNDNVLFGAARQIGQWVVVETGQGGEIQLPRQEVACWAASIRDLYRYRLDHRRDGDLAAMIRDARWCLRYDLHDLVAQELREIRKIDPANSEAAAIEGQLQRLARSPAAVSATAVAPQDVQPASLQQVRFEPAQEPGGLDLGTLREFASHVQPMLLNRCGRCHDQNAASATGVGWKLVVPPAGTRPSSRITRENLAALIPYLDPASAERSPLLVKATSAHGGGPAGLDARNAKAAHSLRSWLVMAGRTVADKPAGNQPEAVSTTSLHPPAVAAGDAASIAEAPPVIAETNVAPTQQPQRLPQVANPFDPDLFNRRFHMKTTGSP